MSFNAYIHDLTENAKLLVRAKAEKDFEEEARWCKREYGPRWARYLTEDPRDSYGDNIVRNMYRDALTQPMKENLPVDDEYGTIEVLEDVYVAAWVDARARYMLDGRI